jgi:hypothetical protein
MVWHADTALPAGTTEERVHDVGEAEALAEELTVDEDPAAEGQG